MGTAAFRDLRAYELAARTGDAAHALVAAWPSFDRWSIGLQLLRAADGVGANIAEASGRWHVPDKRRLLVIARGSLYETEHWLLRAEARGLPTGSVAERLPELNRTLNGLIKQPTPGR